MSSALEKCDSDGTNVFTEMFADDINTNDLDECAVSFKNLIKKNMIFVEIHKKIVHDFGQTIQADNMHTRICNTAFERYLKTRTLSTTAYVV